MAHFAFLFADLAGFTALTEAHGDLDATEVALRFAALVGAALPSEAAVVKTIGDAVMVVSPDAACAVRAAVAIRRALEQEPLFLAVRIGIHRGDAIERDHDYFGAAVNVTARVAAHAGAGQILCTETAATDASSVTGVEFRDVGTVHLKNVLSPIALREVIDASAHSVDVIDPVCRMRLDPIKAAVAVRIGGVEYRFCSSKCAEIFRANAGAIVEELSRKRP